jgi:hypothetical protein
MHDDTIEDTPDTDRVLRSLHPDELGPTHWISWARLLLYNNVYETGRFGGVANAIDGLKSLEMLIFQYNSLLAGFQMVSLIGNADAHSLNQLTVFSLILGFIWSCTGCMLSIIVLKLLILVREEDPSFAISAVLGLSPMIVASYAASVVGTLLLMLSVNSYAHYILTNRYLAYALNGVSGCMLVFIGVVQYTRLFRGKSPAPVAGARPVRRRMRDVAQ